MTTELLDSSGTQIAAELIGVSKAYKHFALKNINFALERGTVTGLIGPNGAGKSTTMRILMGLVQPDSGTASVLGKPISSNQAEAKQDIGYFADDMRLYKPETIAWHMQFVRSLFPVWDDTYAEQLLERFGLIAQQTVKGLSHGQRVKTMLMLILARRPKLLVLDEPTNGLDPVAKQEVLTELMRVVTDDERTILYSSHNTQDVEQISDSITFIDRGQVIASSNRDVFLEKWKRIRVHASEKWSLPKDDRLRLESQHKNLYIFSTNDFCDETTSHFRGDDVTIESVETMTLEEIFVSSVMRGREGTL